MNELYDNYFNIWNDFDFIKLCKTLSFKLNTVLSEDLKEVESIRKWVDTFNSTTPITIAGYKISFNSIFIHGFTASQDGSNPSGVEFDYLNNLYSHRELADIIFVTSFYNDQNIQLEKISFNQAKWGNIGRTNTSWSIDKEQLFLLSRFPRFSGVNGSFIPNHDYYVEDRSKTLGSYGLMTKENFLFLSALDLLSIREEKNLSIKMISK